MRSARATHEQTVELVNKVLSTGTLSHWSHDSEDEDTYLYGNCKGFCASLRSDGGFFEFNLGCRYEPGTGRLQGRHNVDAIELRATFPTREYEMSAVNDVFHNFMPNGWGAVQKAEIEKKLGALGVGGRGAEIGGTPEPDQGPRWEARVVVLVVLVTLGLLAWAAV